jgi:aminocarboxymuconate-semialdehyde decarboxylase
MSATSVVTSRLSALPPGLVDVHTHGIDPDLPDVGARHEGLFPTVRRVGPDRAQILLAGRVYREIDDRCWSATARLRDMDAEMVAAQVISPIPVTLCHDQPAAGALALARAQNDFLAALTSQAPDRLFALGCVPLQDPELAIAELDRCVDELGLLGVEIGNRVGARELADPAHRDFFAAAARRGAVVFVHPVDQTIDPRITGMGIGFGMGMPAETGIAAAGLVVSGLLDTAPAPLILLAHGGGTLPGVLPRLAMGQQLAGVPATALESARHLWSDSLTYDVDSLLLAVQRFGAGHVVLGTDYPFVVRETPAGMVLADVRTRDADLAHRIARDNGMTLLAAGH